MRIGGCPLVHEDVRARCRRVVPSGSSPRTSRLFWADRADGEIEHHDGAEFLDKVETESGPVCRFARNSDPLMECALECAPGAGQYQTADLTVGLAC